MKKIQGVKSEAVSPRATYQDVLDAPAHMVAEIVAGNLYTFSRPAMPHAKASAGLMRSIGPPFESGNRGPGGWWIVFEPELHLGKDIVVPDLAGWRRERMPVFPTSAFCTLAPDWVCEVLSPSTRALDLGGKQAVYSREGVGYLWFVDPNEKSLAAFELRGSEWVLIDKLFDDATVSIPPFEAISFDLGELWPPPTVHKSLPEEDLSSRPKARVESEPELIGSSK